MDYFIVAYATLGIVNLLFGLGFSPKRIASQGAKSLLARRIDAAILEKASRTRVLRLKGRGSPINRFSSWIGAMADRNHDLPEDCWP